MTRKRARNRDDSHLDREGVKKASVGSIMDGTQGNNKEQKQAGKPKSKRRKKNIVDNQANDVQPHESPPEIPGAVQHLSIYQSDSPNSRALGAHLTNNTTPPMDRPWDLSRTIISDIKQLLRSEPTAPLVDTKVIVSVGTKKILQPEPTETGVKKSENTMYPEAQSAVRKPVDTKSSEAQKGEMKSKLSKGSEVIMVNLQWPPDWLSKGRYQTILML
jgi:hypothetical protein